MNKYIIRYIQKTLCIGYITAKSEKDAIEKFNFEGVENGRYCSRLIPEFDSIKLDDGEYQCDLEKEVARLRQVLAQISLGDCPEHLRSVEVGYYMDIARAAILNKGDEK